MKSGLITGALALGFVFVSTAAIADDPRDPTMRSAAARARDKAIIKRLNEEQYAHVKQRDAGYAEGWRAYREGPKVNAESKARYDRQMAEWRRAVRLCNEGHYEYCAR